MMNMATLKSPSFRPGRWWRVPSRLPALLIPALVLAGFPTHTSALPPEAQPQPAAEETDSQGEPEICKNTLKWSTASEVDNFGFDVYRSESEDGPFIRLNADPIPGAGTTDEVSRYEYVDETIDPYKDYYYYVESISMSGVREKLTPTYPAPAKLKAEEEKKKDDSASPESDG